MRSRDGLQPADRERLRHERIGEVRGIRLAARAVIEGAKLSEQDGRNASGLRKLAEALERLALDHAKSL